MMVVCTPRMLKVIARMFGYVYEVLGVGSIVWCGVCWVACGGLYTGAVCIGGGVPLEGE